MGNTASSKRRSSSSKKKDKDDVTTRAQQVVGENLRELQAGIQSGIKKLEEQDHPAAQLLDTICSPYLDTGDRFGSNSFYSDHDSDDSRTLSEDETTLTDYPPRQSSAQRKKAPRDERSMETGSYLSQSDGYESSTVEESAKRVEPEEEDREASVPAHNKKLPLASSFAKRCYFTKAGIGGQTQHYEGLTLTGNAVLMLASAMKLKGCPTICDEDLRRVEQTYPNQFSRLPDELLLSSGWRRISKYCHFSNKPIPDGVPFFHSLQRLHPSGGYYFLLAAAVGMVRPIDVEPLTRDTLVLLETDYPSACDQAPDQLIQDPDLWTLVDKFCFFSGGPINTEEDVYYQADFDGNLIYMLAFLSPSLTPAELYKLDADPSDPGLKSVAAVQEVESVYDLTDRDFEDLKLYHLGPCRALPPYILQPQAWTKVLPPHFLAARQTALLRAQDYENRYAPRPQQQQPVYPTAQDQAYPEEGSEYYESYASGYSEQYDDEEPATSEFERQMQHEYDQHGEIPIDEAIAAHAAAQAALRPNLRMDPPEDEPPSLSKNDNYFPDFDEADYLEEENPDEEDYYESKDNGKYYVTSDESPSVGLSDADFAISSDSIDDRHATSPDRAAKQRNPALPPVSPRSPNSDMGYQPSTAMRGAQEILRRNRQRKGGTPVLGATAAQTKALDEPALTSPNTDSDSGTWDTSSDFTGSSVWTENSSNPDRSSRRALILQMAKARMKSGKTASPKNEEEKKVDGGGGELDHLTADLD